MLKAMLNAGSEGAESTHSQNDFVFSENARDSDSLGGIGGQRPRFVLKLC